MKAPYIYSSSPLFAFLVSFSSLSLFLPPTIFVESCSYRPDSNPHSVLSFRTIPTYPGTNLFIRHDNYVNFISPDENSNDDGDSTFTVFPGLRGGKTNTNTKLTVSFMTTYDWGNKCTNPNDYSQCYFLQITPQSNRLTLTMTNTSDSNDSLAATFILHPGYTTDPNTCSFESAAVPGTFLSSYGYSILPSPLSLTVEERMIQRYNQTKAKGELRRSRKFTKAKPYQAWGPVPQSALVDYALELETQDPCGDGYMDCPTVYAIVPPSPLNEAWNNASSWYISPPNSGPPVSGLNFTFGGLTVTLRDTNHAIEIINLVDDPMPPYNFSFVPPLINYNRPDRRAPGCNALGDITLRVQPRSTTNTSSWAYYSSSWGGTHPYVPVPVPGPLPLNVIAADDITPLLLGTPADSRINPDYNLSLSVIRSYGIDNTTNTVTISYNITAWEDTVIGGLGFPMVDDENTDNLNLDQIAFTNSFADPHIGYQHGFVEIIRIVGNVSLLVLPGNSLTKMESWRPLMEDCDFEGSLYEWVVHSEGWQNEWDQNLQAPNALVMPDDLANYGCADWSVPGNPGCVYPAPRSPWPTLTGNETVYVPGAASQRAWHPPSSLSLSAGQTVTYSLKLLLVPDGPRSRDTVLPNQVSMPSLHAVPGYVVSTEMNNSALFVNLPSSLTVSQVTVDPANGVLTVGTPTTDNLPPNTVRIPVQGNGRGRARVMVTFSDGTVATAHYYVLPPFANQIANFGQHLVNTAWLPRDYPDPFGRSASVMPWDREDNRRVLDDARSYNVGLSDDAGASMNLAHAMKVAWAPVAEEVQAKDDYIRWTLYGVKNDTAKPPLRSLQVRYDEVDPLGNPDGIRMCLYYYCDTIYNNSLTMQERTCYSANNHFKFAYPEQAKAIIPLGGPVWAMIEPYSDYTYRGFNVPHQAASWYAMYRIARNYDRLPTYSSWDYYLIRALNTTLNIGTANVGFMDGTIFREILDAALIEGASNTAIMTIAQQVNANMLYRAQQWNQQVFPFSSEFSYDTTGQEEVYVWLSYYNYTQKANQTLDSILAYMRLLPNFAWHGGARSMGDLGNNGKWFINRGGERLLMHYRAGLNNIPILTQYIQYPDDWFLLETGMGALTGQLTNIDENGATSMGFHSVPFVLDFDPHSGDYGCGFTGLTLMASSFLVHHPLLGWQCYLCNMGDQQTSTILGWTPTDPYHVRSYVEPLGTLFIAEAGNFSSFSLDTMKQTVTVTFSPAAPTPGASRLFTNLRLRIDKTASITIRPGTNFQVLDSNGRPVPYVREAYQITPVSNDDDTTTVTVTYTAA